MDKAYVESEFISLTPKINMPKDGAELKCRGPMLLANNYGNIRSRYLTEPSASCHDLCKYGKKHESQQAEKCLTFRRFMANAIALEDVQNLVKLPAAIDRKKRSAIKAKHSNIAKVVEPSLQLKKVGISDSSIKMNVLTPLSEHESIILPESSEQNAESLNREIGLDDDSMNFVLELRSPTHGGMDLSEKESIHGSSKQKIRAQVEEDEVADELQLKDTVKSDTAIKINSGTVLLKSQSIEFSPQVILPKLPDDRMNHVKFSNGISKPKSVSKPKSSSMAKSTHVKTGILKQKNSPASTEACFNGCTNSCEEKVPSNSKEVTMSSKPEMIKQKSIVHRKQSASSRFHCNNHNASSSFKKTNNSAVSATSLIARNPLMRSVSRSNASKSRNGRVNRDEKCLNSNELHAVLKKFGRTKIDGECLESLENSKELDGYVSESAVAEASNRSSNEKIHKKHTRSASKIEGNNWVRRAPVVHRPVDNSSSPYKLKFKRGKVIELQTTDCFVPRKLRFRKGRVLGENASVGDALKRSFRRKRDVSDPIECNPEAHAAMLKKTNSEAKGSMLKYQDVPEKKDVRALLNHVIEETANKLVETRKSKVKALVGAFETVISLQETKPASAV